MSGDASPAFRAAVAEAEWLLYAEIVDVEQAGAGKTTLTLEPVRVFKGPCDPESIVVVGVRQRNPVSRGGRAVVLLGGGEPPVVIGEPDDFPAGELNAAYRTDVDAPATTAP